MKNRTKQKLFMVTCATAALLCLAGTSKCLWDITENGASKKTAQYEALINEEYEELKQDSKFIQHIDMKLDEFYQNVDHADDYDNAGEYLASLKTIEAMNEYLRENNPESYALIQEYSKNISASEADDTRGLVGKSMCAVAGAVGAALSLMELGTQYDQYKDSRFNHDENEMQ